MKSVVQSGVINQVSRDVDAVPPPPPMAEKASEAPRNRSNSQPPSPNPTPQQQQLRARRYKESNIEIYKRKLAERAQARKLKIEQPTWSDAYGHDDEPKPFEEFFRKGAEADDMDIFGDMSPFGGAADTELLLGNLDAGGFYGPLAGGGYVGGGGAAAGGYASADGAAAAAEPAGDVFDLAAFEAQQGGGAQQAPQQNNGTW
jgi:hypothetical protein